MDMATTSRSLLTWSRNRSSSRKLPHTPSRSLLATAFLLTIVACAYIFAPRFVPDRNDADDDDDDDDGYFTIRRLLLAPRHTNVDSCGYVQHVQDQCSFVQAHCVDEQPSLLPYLDFYYCTLGSAQWLGGALLTLWAGLLFLTLGLAASDFFSINLNTMAKLLNMPESLAGVTILAVGNGSPDIFSTFSAFGSNSASLAVGELVGAASFITAVVAGAMALICEFKIEERGSFMRDVIFFMGAVLITCGFLADGLLHMWECVLMTGYYAVYVCAIWWLHWRSKRKTKTKALPAEPRGAPGHVATNQPPTELYSDDPDRVRNPSPLGPSPPERVTTGFTDMSIFDLGPRIEIDGGNYATDEEDSRRMAAEMADSMRVLRPRARRRSTITPIIRPSLVGALEFRSAMAHLGRDNHHHHHRPGGVCSFPAPTRSDSEDRHGAADTPTPDASTGRDHAHSSGAAEGLGALPPPLRAPTDEIGLGPSPDAARIAQRPPSPSQSFTVGGSLAPPPTDAQVRRQLAITGMPVPEQPRLQMASCQDGPEVRSGLSPFPRYTDSPSPKSPNHDAERTEPFPTPSASRLFVRQDSYFPDPAHAESGEEPERYKWWPYSLLPAPDILRRALFPTLGDWENKSIIGKTVSILSIPSIILLVLTLPVVESSLDEESDEVETVVDPPGLGSRSGLVGEVVAQDCHQDEDEWRHFRRLSRSNTGRSILPSPALISLRSPTRSRAHSRARSSESAPDSDQPAKHTVDAGAQNEGQAESDAGDDHGWNRWLVVVQIFAGPQFVAFILWASLATSMAEPLQTWYPWAVIGAFICSVVMFGLLMTLTKETQKPKHQYLLCFVGFGVSIAWISTIAGEMVGVLKAAGVIWNASDAILGLTLFAVGNSVGDLVANATVARFGRPYMALSACFGGPMLNILLGIGTGGAYRIFKSASHKHQKHPDRPFEFKPYRIRVGGSLMVTAITLLVTLVALVIMVPYNKWFLTRRLGLGLIGLWTVSTIVNVLLEINGTWSEFD